MLRKRLLGAVVVRDGWAVQSFGYQRWLPLGKPECIVENLDRWGADGIVVLSIDRLDQGPDLELIGRLGDLGLSTPLTYGGGLATEDHARSAVMEGAERLVLDSVLWKYPQVVDRMASAVGVQALVAALPMVSGPDGKPQHFQHRTGTQLSLTDSIRDMIRDERVSEVLVIDVEGEGYGQGFNLALLEAIQPLTNLPLLTFGGLSRADQIRTLLSRTQIAGVAVGNALNYREHTVGHLKATLTDQPLRPHRLRCTL